MLYTYKIYESDQNSYSTRTRSMIQDKFPRLSVCKCLVAQIDPRKGGGAKGGLHSAFLTNRTYENYQMEKAIIPHPPSPIFTLVQTFHIL